MKTGTNVITLGSWADAREALRHRDLRQGLYDEACDLMEHVIVNLQGAAHTSRRRLENRLFRRETFFRYERDDIPRTIERMLAPRLAEGAGDLVPLARRIMMSLAPDIAGVDRANEVEDFEVLYKQAPPRGPDASPCGIHFRPRRIGVADRCARTRSRATVREWNALMDSGATPDAALGRVVMRADRRDIAVGPFWASPMVLRVNFPAGGFRTTNAMALVDVFGAPIPGLYSAGDAAGGLNPRFVLGGIHISSAITFGFVAGWAAATGDRSARCALPALAEAPATPGTVRMAIVDAAGRRLRVRRPTSGGRR